MTAQATATGYDGDGYRHDGYGGARRVDRRISAEVCVGTGVRCPPERSWCGSAPSQKKNIVVGPVGQSVVLIVTYTRARLLVPDTCVPSMSPGERTSDRGSPPGRQRNGSGSEAMHRRPRSPYAVPSKARQAEPRAEQRVSHA